MERWLQELLSFCLRCLSSIAAFPTERMTLIGALPNAGVELIYSAESFKDLVGLGASLTIVE